VGGHKKEHQQIAFTIMRKIYIQPETEIVTSYLDHILRENSHTGAEGTSENNPSGSGTPEGEGSGTGDDFGARKHFNLWDEWDE
jgi:hypothetical protein